MKIIDTRLGTYRDINIKGAIQDRLHINSKRFDDEFYEFFNEIGAIEFLKAEDFHKIEFLLSRPQLKTPDFRAVKDGLVYLIEVKSQRSSSLLGNELLKEWDAYKATHPTKTKDIHLDYSAQENCNEVLLKAGHIGIAGLYRIFDDMMQKLLKSDAAVTKHFIDIKDTLGQILEITLTRGYSGGIFSIKRNDCQLTDKRRDEAIDPYIKYLKEKCQKAVLQISESGLPYDNGLILFFLQLNISSMPFVKEFVNVQGMINNDLQKTYGNFSIRIHTP